MSEQKSPRVGVIGLGSIGRTHIASWKANGVTHVTAHTTYTSPNHKRIAGTSAAYERRARGVASRKRAAPAYIGCRITA